MIILYFFQMCKTVVVMLFLTLVSEMMNIDGVMAIGWILVNILKFISMSNSSFSSFVIYYISGKVSIKQNPRENSLSRLSKASKTWLRQLLVSTMKLLTFKHYLEVRWLIAIQWRMAFLEWCTFKRVFNACCLKRDTTQRWCCLIILSRWKWIGMRPAIALTSHEGDV